MVSVWSPVRVFSFGARSVAPGVRTGSRLLGWRGRRSWRPSVVHEDAEDAEGSKREEAFPNPQARAADLTGKRVLICEDEGISQMQLRRALVRGGLIVVGSAANGRTAVEMALKTRPDIILMDIRMPVMDGIEALRQISAQVETCVVMLSAFSDDEYRREASEAGATGYIVKPVTGDTLLPALSRIWARYNEPR